MIRYITGNEASVILMQHDFKYGSRKYDFQSTIKDTEHSFAICSTATLLDGRKICRMDIYFEVGSGVAIRHMAFDNIDDANRFFVLWMTELNTLDAFKNNWKRHCKHA